MAQGMVEPAAIPVEQEEILETPVEADRCAGRDLTQRIRQPDRPGNVGRDAHVGEMFMTEVFQPFERACDLALPLRGNRQGFGPDTDFGRHTGARQRDIE